MVYEKKGSDTIILVNKTNLTLPVADIFSLTKVQNENLINIKIIVPEKPVCLVPAQSNIATSSRLCTFIFTPVIC